MSDLLALFRSSSLDLAAIARWFDAASQEARVAGMRSLGKSQQRALFHATANAEALTIDYMVPARLGDLTEVIHEGKNSLPLFTQFQKRFARLPGRPDTLVGYNHQTMSAFTGPGYYEARVDGRQIAVDYTKLPSQKVASWPPIIPNSARLGRFVYADMIDYLRRVSAHVTIGRAVRHGKETENYFLLCRQDS